MMRLCLTVDIDGNTAAPKTLESWQLVQQMLADLTKSVTADAIDERELIDVVGSGRAELQGGGRLQAELQGYGYRWVRLARRDGRRLW